MKTSDLDVRRRLRVLAILAACRATGIVPLDVNQLHSIAYVIDALSPVWGLRVIDAERLKQRGGPLSPQLQNDVDRLVGLGVVIPSEVGHERIGGRWRLSASYELNDELAGPILEAARTHPGTSSEIAFVRESVLALSTMASADLEAVSEADATYSDVLVGVGAVLEVEDEQLTNRSAHIARRFAELAPHGVTLSNAELVHLYIRQLARRVGYVA